MSPVFNWELQVTMQVTVYMSYLNIFDPCWIDFCVEWEIGFSTCGYLSIFPVAYLWWQMTSPMLPNLGSRHLCRKLAVWVYFWVLFLVCWCTDFIFLYMSVICWQISRLVPSLAKENYPSYKGGCAKSLEDAGLVFWARGHESQAGWDCRAAFGCVRKHTDYHGGRTRYTSTAPKGLLFPCMLSNIWCPIGISQMAMETGQVFKYLLVCICVLRTAYSVSWPIYWLNDFSFCGESIN